MKRIILFALCSLLAGAAVAQAAMTPLVKLLFDDTPTSSTWTANLGSLGGTQNLPPTSGAKSTDVPPTSFDSVTSWVQGGYAATGYGTYNLPAMSAMTAAFWLKSNNDGSFKNVWDSNLGTGGGEIGVYVSNTTLNLLGPGGSRFITAVVIPATPTWTHFAYSYDPGSSAFHLYVNGAEVSYSGSWSGAIVAASDGLGFSIGNTTGSADLAGGLDNLFIYDSVLSQGQVQSLMTTNTIPEPATLGLLALGLFGLVSRRARK